MLLSILVAVIMRLVWLKQKIGQCVSPSLSCGLASELTFMPSKKPAAASVAIAYEPLVAMHKTPNTNVATTARNSNLRLIIAPNYQRH